MRCEFFPTFRVQVVIIGLICVSQLSAATINVSIGNNFFSPASVTVNPGDTVIWTQNGFNHNTESDAGQAESWVSAILTSGQTFSKTFTISGTYGYFCRPHSSVMRGSVIVRAAATPPSIAAHPQSRVVDVGQSVSFTVTAAGTAPLSYRWQFNGTNITGATSSSLTLSNVQISSQGNYRVVVTNSAGTATSSNAVLTVAIPMISLTIEGVAGGSIALCWPFRGSNFVLESNTQSVTNRVWNPVLLPRGIRGTNFCITNPATGSQNFFRLRLTN